MNKQASGTELTRSIDLNLAKKQLSEALGDKMVIYLQMLKAWFKSKSSREDFDHSARNLLEDSHNSVHLHNQFLLAILTKCQKIGLSLLSSDPTTVSHLPAEQRQRPERNKRKVAICNTGLHQRFLAADPLSQAPRIQPQFPDQNDKVPDHASRDMFLPDIAMVHGRIIVAAWEFGLEDVEDDAVHLLMQAIETQLKMILTVTLSRGRGYKLRGKRFRYGLSTQAPLLHQSSSSVALLSNVKDSESTDITSRGQHAPTLRPSVDPAQRDAALRNSCTVARPGMTRQLSITLFDLLEALQVHKSVLPSHTVYTLNVERILDRLHHSNNDELFIDGHVQQNELSQYEVEVKRKFAYQL